MNAANQKRVELAAAPQSALFRLRRSATDPNVLNSVSERFSSAQAQVAVFIAIASLLALASSLSMHLLNLRMHRDGATEFGIGVSVATQALGIVLVAPLAKHAISRLGIRLTFVLGAAIASLALAGFGLSPGIVLASALRMALACGLALLFTVSESLVISRTGSTNRGQVIGWYATGLAVGTAAGPACISLIGVEGWTPLLWSALCFWIMIAPAFVLILKGDELAPVVRKSNWKAINALPVAFLTAFVFGMVDNGGLSMLSLYSSINGYDYSQAALFAAVATTGGILLQIPLGIAASNRDPRLLLILCGVCSIVLLTALPNIMSAHATALMVSFFLGGLLEGFYTIGLVCVAKQCRNIGVSSANGCFVSMTGLGEFVGPIATGTGIEYVGSNGFVIGLALILAVYLVLLICIKQEPSERAA